MDAPSTLSRFFALFAHAGINQRAFRPLWHWAMLRLPSLRGGYALDLDSTRLLHEDGHMEGVEVGYARIGYKLCLQKFFATEAALSLVVVAYNPCVLFQRRLGSLDRITTATLRCRIFTTGGVLSRSGGRTTLRLVVPPEQRSWWRNPRTKKTTFRPAVPAGRSSLLR